MQDRNPKYTPAGVLMSVLLFVGAAALLGGCGQAVSRTAVPEDLINQAQVADMPRIRYWGDQRDPDLQRDLAQMAKDHPFTADPRSEAGPGLGGLVLSGGGDCGAYGAGLLCGWTERGDRPRFRFVSGVSTGSLIAPFAFLGPRYDESLRFYTKVSAKDIMEERSIFSLVRYDSFADSAPLQKLVEKLVDDEVIRQVAAEHAKGRRMYVQTVNLDAQRPVVWDMGAIASSPHLDAPKLFRQVLVASASIPGAFPPQYIRVTAGGKTYDEMHVDGGTWSQMLMSTLPIDLGTLQREVVGARHQPVVHVIRNATIRPEWKAITPKLFPIAGRSVSTLIKAQGDAELKLMYLEAKEAGVAFHLAYIPNDYVRKTPDEFDPEEMQRMFEIGFRTGKDGTAWQDAPPRYRSATQPTTQTARAGEGG